MTYWTRLKCFSGPLGVKGGENLFCFILFYVLELVW